MIPAIYFLIVVIYGLVLVGLWLRDFAITILGCIAMFALGIYMFQNGTDYFTQFMNTIFSSVTIGVASYVAIRGGIELVKG